MQAPSLFQQDQHTEHPTFHAEHPIHAEHSTFSSTRQHQDEHTTQEATHTYTHSHDDNTTNHIVNHTLPGQDRLSSSFFVATPELYNIKNLPISTLSKSTGCGFILLNHNEQMEIIIRKKPYNNSFRIESTSQVVFPSSLKFINKKKLISENCNTYFAEQFAIPRGGGEKNENILTTAVRELIEETGMHLEKLQIFNVFFELNFVDDKEYKYYIFMGYSQKSCTRLNVNKYLVLNYDEQNNVFNVKETAKSVFAENRYLANALIQYKDYIRFMYKSQLKCYISSNYPDLFTWMKTLIYEKKQGNATLIYDPNDSIFFSWNQLRNNYGLQHWTHSKLNQDISNLDYSASKNCINYFVNDTWEQTSPMQFTSDFQLNTTPLQLINIALEY